MKKRIILTSKAPAPVGPYSQAVLENFSYRMEVSGQIGIDIKTGKLAEGITQQLEMALSNIQAILSEVGWGFENIVKTRIFLASMGNYKEVNEIYAKRFSGAYPARVVVAVKDLPLGALVEVECSAAGEKAKEI